MDRKKTYRQYFTPKKIAEIIVNEIEIETPKNIVDLSVGEGELLIACNYKWDRSLLYGIDIDGAVLKKLNKKKLNNIKLFKGNSINNKVFKNYDINNVLFNGGFELCIGNPPFNAYNRIKIGNKNLIIPLEYIFLKKYIEICKENGQIVIILPNGIFSNNIYRYIRQEIVEELTIKKIISLPYKAFENAAAKTEILFLQKKKDKRKKNSLIELIKIDNNCNIIVRDMVKIKNSELINRMDMEYYMAKKVVNKTLFKEKALKHLVFKHNRGATEYGEKRFFSNKGLKYLHTKNITDIGINYLKYELYIEENSNMDKKSAHTKVGDVVMSRVGKILGKVAIINNEDDIGVASDCLFIFQLIKINPYYFVILMKTNFMKNRLRTLIHGSCARVINKKELLEMKIPLLENSFQKYIEEKYKKILSEYNKNNSNNEELTKKLNDLIKILDNKLGGKDE
ncbi:N-6 DNA methylase [Clostridium botulinum]|uniref:N-6 DNA methylase n=1 Tax=Clostridium botulinum TaxID=1491 RepID=UPI003EF1BA13